MSVAELKEEVIRQFAVKIESASNEKVLRVFLEFLDGIETGDKDGMNLSRHYDGIKAKYGSVLKRLAE